MKVEERFWMKSWDEGIADLDSSLWEEKSYIDAIKPAFKEFSEKMAIEFLGIEITFGELDRYSNQFAHMLLENGFKKDDKIGISLVNIPQYLIALLGAMKVGCVVTGVSPLLSEEQLIYQLKDVEAKGIITLDAVYEKRLVAIASELPDLKLIVYTNLGDFLPKIKQFLGKLIGKIPKGKISPLKGITGVNFVDVIKNSSYSTDNPNVKLNTDDIAFILYTGGTTGPPKGALLTNRNILSDILLVMHWLNWEYGKGIALSGFPFFHIAGLFFAMNCMYLGWGQLLIPDPRNTDHICESIEKYRPTALVNVPSLYQMLLKNKKFKTLDHSKLEICFSSASPFPVESQKELESIVGKEKLLEVYGMTETGPLTTMNPFKKRKKLGSIGLPLMNT
jgi:long-chain acyl-CoA synthetase